MNNSEKSKNARTRSNRGFKNLLTLTSLIGSLVSSGLAVPADATNNENMRHPFSPASIANSGFISAIRCLDQMFADGFDSGWGSLAGDIMSGAASGVDQGHYDDCYFESGIGAVSRTCKGQELFSRMIVQTGPGQFSATFPDQPNRTYEITAGDIAKLGLKDQDRWAAVLEAAALKRYPQAKTGGAAITEVITKEGFTYNAQLSLHIFTGSPSPRAVETATASDAELSSILVENARLQIPTLAGAQEPDHMPNPRKIIVVPKHCYAVISFNKSLGVITVRNPWGRNFSGRFPDLPQRGQTIGGVTDLGGGILNMSLTDFKKYFRFIAFAPIQNR